MMRFVRIELHDPAKSTKATPAIDHVRLIYTDVVDGAAGPAGQDDVSLQELPETVSALLRAGAFTHARDLGNAWFAALAHLHGHWQVTV